MKILYAGQIAAGTTCEMRLGALRNLGFDVTGLDSTVRIDQSRGVVKLARRGLWRLGWPMDFEGVNQQLRRSVAELRPDLVWIDKGLSVTAATLRQLKQSQPGIKLVHYNPDDPFGGFGMAGWRTFLDAIPDYDIHLVPRRENVAEYAQRGARKVVQLMPAWGYSPEVHRPVPVVAEDLERFGADVGFVGSFEPERAGDLLAAARAGLNVRIVGPWPAAFLQPGLLHHPQAVFGTDYARALRSFKIALGFLRKNNRDQHTSRSIEIPACGVFMLAERSDEHRMLLVEGQEAEFFSSAAELIDKARYYLAHDRQRERIAAAGRERCLASGYSNEQCMARVVESVTAAA